MKNYSLSFTKEKNLCWYIDLPNWPFAHQNLMMVCGADDLCDELSYDGEHTSIDVMISNKEENLPGYIQLKKIDSKLLAGATYKVDGSEDVKELWLCPVTLFVFGKYPKYIYIKDNHDE
jgi:hypothetical protein